MNPSVRDSLRPLTSDSMETRVNDVVQNTINGHIKGYPNKSRVDMHKVKVRVRLSMD